MQNRPSADPRDQAIRAALRDASTICGMVADEVKGTYRGERRDVYVRTLAAYIADLGGSLEEGEGRDLVAQIGSRRITLRFG
jgi:hypothetical protein